MKITYNQLLEQDACPDQLLRFKREFGKSVVVTRAKCLKYAEVFDWNWATTGLLDYRGYVTYWKIVDSKDLITPRDEALAFWEGVKADEKMRAKKKVQPKRKGK